MSKIKDETGKRYGRLVVTERALRNTGVAYWHCICDCGKTTITAGNKLRRGYTVSCGCLAREKLGRLRRTHGATTSPEYRTWLRMKRRCYDANSTSFVDYGGRGITVCDEWRNDFAAFAAYVGTKPSSDHSLDRINNDGNYEPGNVRWATRSEQMRNRRWARRPVEETSR